MKFKAPYRLLLFFFLTPALFAVSVDSKGLKNNKLFGIEFVESGLSYYGKAAAIQSLSLQEYQSGPFIVTEMVIDMAGSPSQLRIYHTELITGQDIQSRLPDEAANTINRPPPPAVQSLIDRGRKDMNKAAATRVVKDYPTATHAHTLEFRLALKQDLEDLYRMFRQRYARKAKEETPENENESLGGALFKL